LARIVLAEIVAYCRRERQRLGIYKPDDAPFLRKSNAASALCATCHSK